MVFGHPDPQHDFFTRAYRQSIDTWSYLDVYDAVRAVLPAQDGILLDIGCGRGYGAEQLAAGGAHVVGVDFVNAIVEEARARCQKKKIDGIGFLSADIFAMPFVDESFTCAVDVQTLQHMPRHAWRRACAEVWRVLALDGWYVNVSLSKKTETYFGHSPATDPAHVFARFGLAHHFFDDTELAEEIRDMFVLRQQTHYVTDSRTDPGAQVVFVVHLFQKIGR